MSLEKENSARITLTNFVQKLDNTIDAESLKAFAQVWQLIHVKRKTILSHPGKVDKHLYFVIDGVQRIYSVDEKGREATLVLTYPHSFAGVVDSFSLQTPSRYYFESLSQSWLLVAEYHDFQEVLANHPKMDALIRKMSFVAMSGLLERMAELQSYTSEEKFKSLLRRSPHILQHVPHKYLANYLGIDATNFSKLINSATV